jgi:hypothetical protein
MKTSRIQKATFSFLMAACVSPAIADDATTVTVHAGSFKPVNMVAPASSQPSSTQLSTTRPVEITNVPKFKGTQQWYGYLDLGNQANRRFYFALDLVSKNNAQIFVMYFDKNKNGNLADDGDPLKNQGSGSGGPGAFATQISVPWKKLIESKPFKGKFDIWFFINQQGWDQGQMASHYSQTQLKGKVKLSGKKYKAFLVDQGYNDADLTNDGIILDLNGNGHVDPNEQPSTTQTVQGKTYNFSISW